MSNGLTTGRELRKTRRIGGKRAVLRRESKKARDRGDTATANRLSSDLANENLRREAAGESNITSADEEHKRLRELARAKAAIRKENVDELVRDDAATDGNLPRSEADRLGDEFAEADAPPVPGGTPPSGKTPRTPAPPSGNGDEEGSPGDTGEGRRRRTPRVGGDGGDPSITSSRPETGGQTGRKLAVDYYGPPEPGGDGAEKPPLMERIPRERVQRPGGPGPVDIETGMPLTEEEIQRVRDFKVDTTPPRDPYEPGPFGIPSAATVAREKTMSEARDVRNIMDTEGRAQAIENLRRGVDEGTRDVAQARNEARRVLTEALSNKEIPDFNRDERLKGIFGAGSPLAEETKRYRDHYLQRFQDVHGGDEYLDALGERVDANRLARRQEDIERTAAIGVSPSAVRAAFPGFYAATSTSTPLEDATARAFYGDTDPRAKVPLADVRGTSGIAVTKAAEDAVGQGGRVREQLVRKAFDLLDPLTPKRQEQRDLAVSSALTRVGPAPEPAPVPPGTGGKPVEAATKDQPLGRISGYPETTTTSQAPPQVTHPVPVIVQYGLGGPTHPSNERVMRKYGYGHNQPTTKESEERFLGIRRVKKAGDGDGGPLTLSDFERDIPSGEFLRRTTTGKSWLERYYGDQLPAQISEAKQADLEVLGRMSEKDRQKLLTVSSRYQEDASGSGLRNTGMARTQDGESIYSRIEDVLPVFIGGPGLEGASYAPGGEAGPNTQKLRSEMAGKYPDLETDKPAFVRTYGGEAEQQKSERLLRPPGAKFPERARDRVMLLNSYDPNDLPTAEDTAEHEVLHHVLRPNIEGSRLLGYPADQTPPEINEIGNLTADIGGKPIRVKDLHGTKASEILTYLGKVQRETFAAKQKRLQPGEFTRLVESGKTPDYLSGEGKRAIIYARNVSEIIENSGKALPNESNKFKQSKKEKANRLKKVFLNRLEALIPAVVQQQDTNLSQSRMA